MREESLEPDAAVAERKPALQVRSTERVTCILKVHHVGVGLPTTSKDLAFDEPCQQDGQQVYDRRQPVASDVWVPLTAGSWVENPGVILVQNLTAPPRGVLPTDEQKAAAARAVLQIAAGTEGQGVLLVHPGRFVLLDVADPAEWMVRSAEGVAMMSLTVYPR